MASENARAKQAERVALQQAVAPAEPVRTRHVSGWAPKPTLDTSLLLDEDRESEDLEETNEPTLVAAGELIESLRAASRATPESAPFTAAESQLPYFAGNVLNEDDTTIFVLHEDKDLYPAWLRTALPIFAGAAILTALLTLLATPSPSAGKAMPRKAVSHVAPPAPREQKAPVPTVVQLQPATPVAAQDAIEKPVAQEGSDQAQHELDTQRKWMRALERGNARMLAGEYDSAVFSFERAIEYHPQDPKAYAGLAEAQRERGKWNEAARAYREAIALSPDDPSLRAALDVVHEQAKQGETAPQTDEKAVEHASGGSE